MLFFVFPEQVTQNRNDWTMRKRIAWLKQNPNVFQERLTLNLNGKKHQHCLIVLQRISRGKSKCLPFVVGIPLKLNKNIPHFSLTVLNANRRTFFGQDLKKIHSYTSDKITGRGHLIHYSLTKLYIIAQWLYNWVQLDRAELRSLPILWSKNNFPLLCPTISNSLSTSWQLGHKRSQFGNDIEIFNTVMLIQTCVTYIHSTYCTIFTTMPSKAHSYLIKERFGELFIFQQKIFHEILDSYCNIHH